MLGVATQASQQTPLEGTPIMLLTQAHSLLFRSLGKIKKQRPRSRVISRVLEQALDVAAGVIISSVIVYSGHYHHTTQHEGRLKSLPQLQVRHTLTRRWPPVRTGDCELSMCSPSTILSWNRMRNSNLEYQHSPSHLHSHFNDCFDWSRISFLVPISSASSFVLPFLSKLLPTFQGMHLSSYTSPALSQGGARRVTRTLRRVEGLSTKVGSAYCGSTGVQPGNPVMSRYRKRSAEED